MMQMVTCTLRFCASASAAATIVLSAARFKYFFEGRSAAEARKATLRNSTTSLSMALMITKSAGYCGATVKPSNRLTLSVFDQTPTLPVTGSGSV